MAAEDLSRRRFLGTSLGAAAAGLVSGRGSDTVRAGRTAVRAAAEPQEPMPTVTAGEGKYAGRTNAAIQRAVDDMAEAGGGTVIVAPGTYEMHDALHLRSGVRVVGRDGPVLEKAASAESRIPDFLGYGHYEVTVEEPEKFPVGTGVHVLDDAAGGFYTTVATVVGRDGERLFINRMMNHDYHVKRNARVVSVFPIVEGEGVADACVEGMVIDGSAARQSMFLNGCRGGGVFLILCGRVALRNVEVRDYRGDGISFQQCTDILVEGCHVHGNAGSGLHPGSGSVRYVMQDNRLLENEGCGIYYCLRTTHSICRRNTIRGNGRCGISVGERDTDHLIEANTVAGNAEEGVLLRGFARRGGDRVLLVKNTIGPNGAKKQRPEIALAGGLTDVHVLDNALTPGQAGAVTVGKGCRNVSFADNTVAGRGQRPDDVAGAADGLLFERPKRLPAVGPKALAPDGARHLAMARLGPWDEQRMWR